jgi:acyl-CoA dehydrogenase
MEVVRQAKDWQRARFDHGFGWITGPIEYGGAGLTQAHERAYLSVEREYRTANLGVFQIGLGMVAPTILAHATPAARDRYLRPLWRADIVGCQLFSEPGAGSDLASLQAKAERDGDEWILTGQKVWTSGAQFSDIGEIICRTDPGLPKHKGLTGFIVDMRAPGVEIRPLRQMTGGASFNEVFFNEVRVPDENRLGGVNEGWTVALTTLMNERASIGSMGSGETSMYTRILAMIRHFDVDDDPIVRDLLADLYINSRLAGWTSQRGMDKMRAGQTPGPEMSIGKMALVANQKRMIDLVAHVLGPKIQADTGEWGTYAWSQLLLGAPGMRIAGGSDEVMRNIVSERVLGLPKDPGIDSKSAFRDLKVGTQKD